MKLPDIAASSYLNAAPLCFSFLRGQQRDRCHFLSDEAPARCSDLLSSGEADAALIPVIEYQRVPSLRIVPEVCVSSKRAVHSVILASKVPIQEICSVALDTSSRTSAALIQIILRQFYQIKPAFEPFQPDLRQMLSQNDAALLIGDPAMVIDRAGLKIYDLATEWRAHTGLPFVFAFWAVRSSSRAWLENGVDFVAAKNEGIANLQTIAKDYSRNLGLSLTKTLEYLTENISYNLDQENLRGLALYYELALDLGIISKARELEFV